MDLISKLEYQKNFTDLEKQVANYILAHKESFYDMSIQDLAQATYVSPSTISRMCKKMGDKNYNSFKHHFLSSVQLIPETKSNVNKPFNNDNDYTEIIAGIATLYHDTIADTNRVIDMDSLVLAAKKLHETNNIIAYGLGDSFISCLTFQEKMLHINKVVYVPYIPGQEYEYTIRTITKDSVALIISYSGDASFTKVIIDMLKAKNTCIIAITSVEDNYLRRNADIVLSMSSKENYVSKIASYSSKLSSDYIIDLLYSFIFKFNFQENLIDKVSQSRIWDERINEVSHEKK